MITSWRSFLFRARWLMVVVLSLILVIWIALSYQYRVVTDIMSDGLLEELRADAEFVAALVGNDVQILLLSLSSGCW